MRFERIFLAPEWPDAWLDVYTNDRPIAQDGVLVIPGGGYSDVCTDREGEPIALAFLGQGFSAFVLHYTVAPKGVFPQQLQETALAMAHIRTHSETYHVNPDRIFVCGFSAGGHLAGSMGTLWHLPAVAERIGAPCETVRPKGMILCYPVISGGPFAHRGSFNHLLGAQSADSAALDSVSLEKQVDARTVPAFLMHTANDRVVPVENSLLMASALSAYKIPFELHIYPKGSHGIGLANFLTANGYAGNMEPAIARWVEHAVYWMRNLK
jgi:acetyl esterase/lipase